jgi:hypothetical protein
MNTDIQALQEQIELLQTLRIGSGVLAILFLLLCVLIFWKFKIWRIILSRTGISRKKSISQMQELNAATGRLTQNSGAKIAAQEFTGQLPMDKKKERKARKTSDIQIKTEPITEETPASASPAYPPEAETTVLSQEASFGGRFVITVNQVIVHTNEMIPGVET